MDAVTANYFLKSIVIITRKHEIGFGYTFNDTPIRTCLKVDPIYLL